MSAGTWPDRAEIEAAARRIEAHVRRTPCLDVDGAPFGLDRPVSLKLELFQHTGSFKTRGAFNALLSAGDLSRGVAAASGGNHGAAAAHAARALGAVARIFAPETAPPAKIAKIRAAGADLTLIGARYAEARAAAEAHIAATGALDIHAYDAPETVAGQGSVAREWDAQAGPLDTAAIAVGGGGLIAGAAAWWGGTVALAGVEPDGARALGAALDAGAPVDVPVESLAADSLGASRIGEIAFAVATATGIRPIALPDEAIREGQRRLWIDYGVAAEPGGAAAFAALASGLWKPDPGARVGVLVCGANFDPADLSGAG